MSANLPQTRNLFIDPPYRDYYGDRLFDVADANLNRDGTLQPFFRMREQAANQGKQIQTADFLLQGEYAEETNDYYSLGLLDNFKKVASEKCAYLAAFIIMEPPVVAPKLYKALPALTAAFDRVYVHNTHGDGYSLEGVESSKLRKLYWPIPFSNVLETFWNNQERLQRVVVINGNHNPRSRRGELYSTRIEAMASLAKFGAVDLFGRGWHEWWSPKSMWLPYWRHRQALMSIYRGACPSKFEVLSRYKFCLCFENMAMDGYITEKLFDCLYTGTIPLYLGAPDISKFVPEDVYVDCRKFSSWEAMWEAVKVMSEDQIEEMRLTGRDFLAGEAGRRFYNSLEEIFELRK